MDCKPPEERTERFLLGILISGVNVKASRIQRLHEPPDLHALSGTVVTVKGDIDRNLFLFAFPLKVPESQHFFLQSFFLLFLLISIPFYGLSNSQVHRQSFRIPVICDLPVHFRVFLRKLPV